MDTVTTTTQPELTTQPTPMKAKQKKPNQKKPKPLSLTKRIVLASDEGKSPQEIAELLGTNVQSVYSVRWQEKKRRGGNIGTEHWFHQEITKEAKRQEQLAKAKEDWDRVLSTPAVQAYNLTSFASPLPKFTFNEPHAPALLPPQTFFARIKAAYAVLRGVKK